MQITYKVLSNYDALIAPATNKIIVVKRNGGVDDTINEIKLVAKESIPMVAKLAKHLRANSLEQSCYNIWHWMKHNMSYKLDAVGKEEIRTASRSYRDRHSGIDCEDYSIFISALLINMGYKPTFHIVAFNHNTSYQHIYVVCENMVMDNVIAAVEPWRGEAAFNMHPVGVTKTLKIKAMTIEHLGTIESMICGLGRMVADNITIELVRLKSAYLAALESNTTAAERNDINRELRKLNFAISLNGTPERNKLLNMLDTVYDIQNHQFVFYSNINLEGIAEYFNEYDAVHALGDLGKIRIWSKEKRKRFTHAVTQGAKNTFNKVKHGAGKVLHTVLKTMPLLILGRNVFLLMLKINAFKLGSILKMAYLPKSEAISKGCKPEAWEKLQHLKVKVENIFHGLGGEKKNILKAIEHGKARLNGLGYPKDEMETASNTKQPLLSMNPLTTKGQDTLMASSGAITAAGIAVSGGTATPVMGGTTAAIVALVQLIKALGLKKEDVFKDDSQIDATDTSVQDPTLTADDPDGSGNGSGDGSGDEVPFYENPWVIGGVGLATAAGLYFALK
jgi:hypothetical protein